MSHTDYFVKFILNNNMIFLKGRSDLNKIIYNNTN